MQTALPAEVPCNDQLGPLPEPAAWNVYWRGDNDGPSWDQWHDESDPLPKAWEDTPPDEVTPYYTAEQVRAYAAEQVAAVRELCARACDVSADRWWLAWDQSADPTDQGRALEAEALAAEFRA